MSHSWHFTRFITYHTLIFPIIYGFYLFEHQTVNVVFLYEMDSVRLRNLFAVLVPVLRMNISCLLISPSQQCDMITFLLTGGGCGIRFKKNSIIHKNAKLRNRYEQHNFWPSQKTWNAVCQHQTKMSDGLSCGFFVIIAIMRMFGLGSYNWVSETVSSPNSCGPFWIIAVHTDWRTKCELNSELTLLTV